MSSLTGQEPAHWHNGDGTHNMTDPREIRGWHPSLWDQDERAYVAHLETHEGPAPLPGDSPIVLSIIALRKARLAEVERLTALIAEHRRTAMFRAALRAADTAQHAE